MPADDRRRDYKKPKPWYRPAIEIIRQGGTLAQAAKAANVSESTIYKENRGSARFREQVYLARQAYHASIGAIAQNSLTYALNQATNDLRNIAREPTLASRARTLRDLTDTILKIDRRNERLAAQYGIGMTLDYDQQSTEDERLDSIAYRKELKLKAEAEGKYAEANAIQNDIDKLTGASSVAVPLDESEIAAHIKSFEGVSVDLNDLMLEGGSHGTEEAGPVGDSGARQSD